MEMNIINNTSEAVLLEVTFKDVIDQMSQRGFTGQERYIKMTKGKNHQMTVYDESSKVMKSFSFGESGYTVISEDTKALRDKVTSFLLRQRIQMRKQTTLIENELKIMLPKKGLGVDGHYCVHLGGEYASYLPNEEMIRNIFGEYEVYDSEIAPTGVIVQHAKIV